MTDATPAAAPLTVVLVHGAFADASSWNGVVDRLLANGVQVVAPANPLRGIAGDAAYTASFINQIPGPVLAVAHSYGGAVLANACVSTPNVVGMVNVSGFFPEVGEVLLQVEGGSKDSVLSSALGQLMYPAGDGSDTAVEFIILADKFHDAFAADLPVEQAALMAATQRPAAQACFTDATTAAAWKTLPLWAVVGTGDKAAGADVVRSMAERAGATITELEGSHVIMISQPQGVTDVIMTAIAAVS
jgi:pimeloyl-ACP methyl ester carboxylesterase